MGRQRKQNKKHKSTAPATSSTVRQQVNDDTATRSINVKKSNSDPLSIKENYSEDNNPDPYNSITFDYSNNDVDDNYRGNRELIAHFSSLKLTNEHGASDLVEDQVLVDSIDAAIDGLLERRFKEINRINGLSALSIHLLDACGRPNVLQGKCETLISLLIQTFRRGSNSDIRTLGARALISLAAGTCDELGSTYFQALDSLFEQLCAALPTIISNTDEDLCVRTSYIGVLCTFQLLGFGDANPHLKREIWTLFLNMVLECRISMLDRVDFAQIVSESIFAWATLVSSMLLHDHSFAVQSILRFVDKVVILIQCPAVSVRIAAGQSLALIDELTRQDDQIDFVVSKDVKRIINELANESNNKSQSKKEQLAHRTAFRDIERSILDRCYYASTVVKLGKRCLSIGSWRVRFHYDFLAKILGNKLSSYLMLSHVVQQLLNYDPDEDEFSAENTSTTKLNKNSERRYAAKDRYLQRNSDRNKKSFMNQMY